MPTEPRSNVNPFASPIKITAFYTQTEVSPTKSQQPDVLATADLLLEQIKVLENLCSTVEERVQRKRRALKELEHLIFGSNTTESPCAPSCPTNTPIHSRLHLVSPRLRGLFDLRGPGQANLDSIQTCLDYSPEYPMEDNLSTRENPGHSDEWVDEDEEALFRPFDHKYVVQESTRKVEKALSTIPHERVGEVLESKIPRKIRRRASASRTAAGRTSGLVARSASNRRRASVRNVMAATNAGVELVTKGMMRRGSWKRSILENVTTKDPNSAKVSSATENEETRDGGRVRKEKRKGLWSIYSVCSDLGPNGAHQVA